MKKLLLITALLMLMTTAVMADECVDCHNTITPGAVSDWKLSKHFENEIGCSDCHGEDHKTADDVANVLLPKILTPAKWYSQ
jgi:hypothetical protein